jgi:hypothetical protein
MAGKDVSLIVKVLETARLGLRWLETNDADFILQLVNEPSWLRFIGDKGIRTVEDARNYIEEGRSRCIDAWVLGYTWLS